MEKKLNISGSSKVSAAGGTPPSPAGATVPAAREKDYTPRSMTTQESVLFMVKLGGGAGLLIALLWYLNRSV